MYAIVACTSTCGLQGHSSVSGGVSCDSGATGSKALRDSTRALTSARVVEAKSLSSFWLTISF